MPLLPYSRDMESSHSLVYRLVGHPPGLGMGQLTDLITVIDTELRYMVYKYALISPCAQPGIADIFQKPEYFHSLEDDEDIPDRYIYHESIPAATVLWTSKQVYSEANSLLYSHNTFTTFFRPKGRQIDEVLDALAEARGQSGCPCSTGDWVARAWVDYHEVLAQGISQINSPDLANLPYWLFGDFAPSTVSRSDHWDSWSFDPVLGPYGFFFAAFLRKIGRSNTAMIKSVELTLDTLLSGAGILPFFTEILKQHVKGLRALVIVMSLPVHRVLVKAFD